MADEYYAAMRMRIDLQTSTMTKSSPKRHTLRNMTTVLQSNLSETIHSSANSTTVIG